MNELLAATRLSRDIDLFHDTESALHASCKPIAEAVLLQWVRDSVYRFFPLIQHPELGLTLHPFDLATNKVLALVGRLEVRDWVDTIECSERLQPLGYLAWAACGKDQAGQLAQEPAPALTMGSCPDRICDGVSPLGPAPPAAAR